MLSYYRKRQDDDERVKMFILISYSSEAGIDECGRYDTRDMAYDDVVYWGREYYGVDVRPIFDNEKIDGRNLYHTKFDVDGNSVYVSINENTGSFLDNELRIEWLIIEI